MLFVSVLSSCMVEIEVIYIAADKTSLVERLSLEWGATVADALNNLQLISVEQVRNAFAVGIFSKKVTMDTQLKPGDRIEIYRPLGCDPKEKRRQRAKTANKPV